MSKLRTLMILPVVLLLISISCNSAKSSSGVAQIDETEIQSRSKNQSDLKSNDSKQPTSDANTLKLESPDTPLTDEGITTRFTSCMRDHGFDTPDPELNADGTVNLDALRISISEDPEFDIQSRETINAFQKCTPLLEGATFARSPSQEDEVEFQDNLLQFAQCLRDDGVDVPDPDFSNGTRAAMVSLFQKVDPTNSHVQESMELCRSSFTGPQ
jgi:hypothetical protein